MTAWASDRDRVVIRITLPVNHTDELRPLGDKVLRAVHDHAPRLFGLREWHVEADYHVVSEPAPARHLHAVPDPDGAA